MSSGSHTAVSGPNGAMKSLGMTPTTCRRTPSRVIDRPIALGSPDSARCQKLQLTIAALASPEDQTVPIAGRTPMV